MAYTKYSLTPANNNAAPPDGAPEGMLPSAVNDTMRDMMAQIRDVGDGIRGGTYTMTAPVITGGSINGTTVGAGTASTGAFTTLAYTGTLTGGTGVVNLGSGQFYKDASGNVGIGTASPTEKLDVNGGTLVRGAVNQTTGNGGLYTSSNGSSTATIEAINPGSAYLALTVSAGTQIFSTNGSERMRIDSSGNVGIGTNTIGTKFDVLGAGIQLSGTTYATSQIIQDGTTKRGLYFGYDTSGQIGVIAANSAGAASGMSFWGYTGSAWSERMRIDSGGRLLVGTTSNPVTSGGGYAGAIACVGIATKAGATGAYDGNVFNIRWDGNAGTAQLYIDGSNIGTITVVSDYRIKRNIQAQTTPALERIMALRPVTYQMADYGDLFKAGEKLKEGFIAHEVQEVIPSGADGVKDDPIQIQSLRLDAILAVAVKAIQELKATVDAQAARIAALESK